MAFDSESRAAGDACYGDAVPGTGDSALLVADSLVTLFLLFRSEAALAVSSVGHLLVLNLVLLPLALLAWIGLGAVLACVAYALTASAVVAATAFLALQLLAIVLLRRRMQDLRARLNFPLSRQGLATLEASWKGRTPRP